MTNITISSSVGAATLHSGWVDLDRTEHRSLLPLPPFPSFVRIDVVVDATASYPGLARPRIDVRTRLTSFHVPHPALVPQIAHLRIVALLRPILSIENSKINRTNLLHFSIEEELYILTYRIVASKRFKRVQQGQRRRIPHPLNRLPISHDPHIVHRYYRVQE